MVSLVIGASGLVGYEFYRQKKNDGSWYFTYNNHKMNDFLHLDAGNLGEVRAIFNKINPNTVIFPAAMPNVNRCETEPEEAERANLGILQNVMDVMNGKGKIVFYSTDYLFDGKNGPYSEDARVNPLNAYGRIKLKCEKAIQASDLEYLILRTTGIFGWEKYRKNFFYRIYDNLSQGKKQELPEDQYATPVYVKDLVAATITLLELGKTGIYNVSGSEFMNRVELATRFAELFNLDTHLVSGKKTAESDNVAPRPLRAGLKIDRITKLGIKMRNIREALADMKKNKETEDVYPD